MPRSRAWQSISESVISARAAISPSSHSAWSTSGDRRWPRVRLGANDPVSRQRRTHPIWI